jgi:ubiquinone/menaquinone biosynthesis C-methylase UbiE
MSALKPFKGRRRVFMGYKGEGGDHAHWHNHGVNSWMDLATPVEVIQLAKGHLGMLQIPFHNHDYRGEPCPGPLYEYKRSKRVCIYRCGNPGCKYEMIFSPPDRQNYWHAIEHPIVIAYTQIERDHWETRAADYRNLSWAQNEAFLEEVVAAGDPQPADRVLDAGTGPGYIANAVAPKVTSVVGLDISKDMMENVQSCKLHNQEFIEGDVRAIPYPAGYFDKVYARQVFHGLIASGDLNKATRECYRVLKEGGKFVLCEGVANTRGMHVWYSKMMDVKEKRVNFTPRRMRKLLKTAGFTNIQTYTHIIEQNSTKNWLENSGLAKDEQKRIMQLRWDMPDYVKKAYNANYTEDDVLVDIKFTTVVGRK